MCLLRVGPEHAPDDRVSIAIILFLSLLAKYLALTANASLEMSKLLSLGWTVVPVAALATLLWFFLKQVNKENRLTKTLMSLLACDIILTLPIYLLAQLQQLNPGTVASPFIYLTEFMQFTLLIYRIVVFGFILKEAFETTMLRGCLIMILLVILSGLITLSLLPAPEIITPDMTEMPPARAL